MNHYKMLQIISLSDAYHMVAFFVFEPGPVGRQWIAVAHTHHHTFVLLIAMLRVLVCCNVGNC